MFYSCELIILFCYSSTDVLIRFFSATECNVSWTDLPIEVRQKIISAVPATDSDVTNGDRAPPFYLVQEVYAFVDALFSLRVPMSALTFEQQKHLHSQLLWLLQANNCPSSYYCRLISL